MQLVTFINNLDQLDVNDTKTNNPVLRKNKIVECLQKDTNCIFKEINEGIDINWLTCIHDIQYLEFLCTCYSSFNKSDISWSDPYHGVVPCNFYKKKPDSLVPTYKLSGFYGSDIMTPIYENTWKNASISANQAYAAATYLHNHPHDIIYVLATSPGHHAKTSEYGGYCFINNAMVAAKRLIELDKKVNNANGGRKIAILDIDYHAGNGTYEMASYTDNIYAYSIHCDPVYDYPSFDGFNNEYNYAIKPHTIWSTYEDTLKKACEKIISKNIDILIIAFGGDTFKDDPDAISIGRFELDLQSYHEMGKIIKEYFHNVPIMITQEGGYNMEHIGTIVFNFIQGIKQ